MSRKRSWGTPSPAFCSMVTEDEVVDVEDDEDDDDELSSAVA